MRSPDCCVVERGQIVQRKENGMAFRILNSTRVDIEVCKVDDCLISGAQKICDYLFEVENRVLWLVELKGVNHLHALRQIISAAECLNLRTFRGEKRSAIVGAPAPKTTASYLKEMAKLKKRYDAVGLALPVKKNLKIEVEV
jgi:hypothetical protein